MTPVGFFFHDWCPEECACGKQKSLKYSKTESLTFFFLSFYAGLQAGPEGWWTEQVSRRRDPSPAAESFQPVSDSICSEYGEEQSSQWRYHVATA